MGLDLKTFDELTATRSGRRGRPAANTDEVTTETMVKAATVMLSAALQSFIEDEFIRVSGKALDIEVDDEVRLDSLRRSIRHWGNPDSRNTKLLFRRVGIDDVFAGLAWQNQTTKTLKKNLDILNSARNSFAHGSTIVLHNDKEIHFGFYEVRGKGNVCRKFAAKFPAHLDGLLS